MDRKHNRAPFLGFFSWSPARNGPWVLLFLQHWYNFNPFSVTTSFRHRTIHYRVFFKKHPNMSHTHKHIHLNKRTDFHINRIRNLKKTGWRENPTAPLLGLFRDHQQGMAHESVCPYNNHKTSILLLLEHPSTTGLSTVHYRFVSRKNMPTCHTHTNKHIRLNKRTDFHISITIRIETIRHNKNLEKNQIQQL